MSPSYEGLMRGGEYTVKKKYFPSIWSSENGTTLYIGFDTKKEAEEFLEKEMNVDDRGYIKEEYQKEVNV